MGVSGREQGREQKGRDGERSVTGIKGQITRVLHCAVELDVIWRALGNFDRI